jgi:hypothetical protein
MNLRLPMAIIAGGALAIGLIQTADAAPISFTQDQVTVPASVITTPSAHTGNFTLSTTGSPSGQSSPFGDNTTPFSCLSCGAGGVGTATYTIAAGMTGFSIFWGSPDSYNQVEFLDGSTPVATVDGNIFLGTDLNPPAGSGHNLVSFSFNGATVTSVVLTDTGTQAFEYSDAMATPLPAALPLFMGGLGMVGFVSRRRKRQAGSPVAA